MVSTTDACLVPMVALFTKSGDVSSIFFVTSRFPSCGVPLVSWPPERGGPFTPHE